MLWRKRRVAACLSSLIVLAGTATGCSKDPGADKERRGPEALNGHADLRTAQRELSAGQAYVHVTVQGGLLPQPLVFEGKAKRVRFHQRRAWTFATSSLELAEKTQDAFVLEELSFQARPAEAGRFLGSDFDVDMVIGGFPRGRRSVSYSLREQGDNGWFKVSTLPDDRFRFEFDVEVSPEQSRAKRLVFQVHGEIEMQE